MATTTQILEKLQLLQELVGKLDESDEVLAASVTKLLHYELEKLQDRQSRVREKLTTFEEKYHMRTEEFFRQFREGKLGDDMDFFEWSALEEIHQELSQKLAQAEQIGNGSADLGVAQ